jgi:hypothetical protein
MKGTQITVLAVLSVLALGAIAATAAQANEGPFWKTEKARLIEGGKQPFESKTVKEAVFKFKMVEIKCPAQKAKNANLIGSTGANAGSGEAVIELEKCTVTGNGATCKVAKKGTIESTPLSMKLAFETVSRIGTIFVFLKPVSGAVFFKLELEGECTFPSLNVEGALAVEVLSEGKPVNVGSEPAAMLSSELNFGAHPNVFIEKEKVLEEVKSTSLRAGFLVGFVDTFENRLTGGQKWCVSTGAAESKC